MAQSMPFRARTTAVPRPGVPKQFLGNRWGQAESSRGVFSVADAQIDLLRRDNVLEVIGDDPAPRRTEYIADK